MDGNTLVLRLLHEDRIKVDFDTGRVFSNRLRWAQGEYKPLPGVHINGYIYHRLYWNGIKKQIRAHRIVWMAAHGEIPSHLVIDHINRVKSDNRLSNLRLVTVAENNANRESFEGEANPGAKLCDEQWHEIRQLLEVGHTYREVAGIYGISKSQVGNIAKSVPVAKRVDRLRALGNAIVPQVAYEIMRNIKAIEGHAAGG